MRVWGDLGALSSASGCPSLLRGPQPTRHCPLLHVGHEGNPALWCHGAEKWGSGWPPT